MKKLLLFLSLSAMTHAALADSVPFKFNHPTKIEVKDLPGRGVLAVTLYDQTFGAISDPVIMTCGDGSEGSLRVFPGETLYCAYKHTKVTVALASKDFTNGSSGYVHKYSFE